MSEPSKTPQMVIAELLDEEAGKGIIAALEEAGWVVVPRKPTEAMLKAGEVPTREIQLGNGQTVRGVGLGAAPWAIWPKMVDARPRHGISHLQEPYTPEPRKEES